MDRKKPIYLAVAGLMFATLQAEGGAREDVLSAMQRCSVMQDDRSWLECTYGAQQIMRAKLGLPPAPEYQQRLVPPVSAPSAVDSGSGRTASVPRRRGSFFQILGGSAPPVAVSNLALVQYDPQGAFTITLQNGQVWHQLDAEDGPRARFKTGTKVTISPGALWTYNLKTEDNPHAYKVERRS